MSLVSPKKSWALSLMGLHSRQHFTYFVVVLLMGKEYTLCDPLWVEESIRKPAKGFLQTPPVSSPLTICVSLLHHYNKS